jgi:hypothetical protein
MKLSENFTNEIFEIASSLTRKDMLTASLDSFLSNPEVRIEIERDRSLATMENPARIERLRKSDSRYK